MRAQLAELRKQAAATSGGAVTGGANPFTASAAAARREREAREAATAANAGATGGLRENGTVVTWLSDVTGVDL